tara:strand:+ start:41263 stop:42141 length:879 start_codon:yes stop_codon:yes gene_type:complete
MFLNKLQIIQSHIANILPTYLPDSVHPLHQALHYACLNGGKRIRPFLVYATGELYNINKSQLDALAVAVELIHCYSLVHDDLPSMDDDTLRRGKPTCHIAYDEATAVLVGDALQALAFEVIAGDPNFIANDKQRLQIIQQLARAIGPLGMVLGQAQDMAATKKLINKQDIFALHNAKTGALIQACVQCSAIACGETRKDKLNNFQKYGQSIGLAFQIQDDLLDATGESELLGKHTGMDHNKHKNTFVSLFGLEQTRLFAQEQFQTAQAALTELPYATQTLNQVAQYIVDRAA